jgi:hypothetical protein
MLQHSEEMITMFNTTKEMTTMSYNTTLADILVNEIRARFKETGQNTFYYTEYDIEYTAREHSAECLLVSLAGVNEVLNTIPGITAEIDSGTQVGPDEWLDILCITLSQPTPTPDTDDDPCANCRDHACEYGSCSMSRG